MRLHAHAIVRERANVASPGRVGRLSAVAPPVPAHQTTSQHQQASSTRPLAWPRPTTHHPPEHPPTASLPPARPGARARHGGAAVAAAAEQQDEGRAPRVVAVLAGLLERAAERGDAEGAPATTEVFRGRAMPGIPVRRYVERIYRYAGCSPACFVVAYVYLDRLARGRDRRGAHGDEDGQGSDEEAPPPVSVVGIDSYTVHRLLITSVLVAAKFMDDRHYNNAYFARVGGVEVSEMNALELRLLFALRFRLNVRPDTFARYCAALECHIVMADDGPAAAAAVPLPPSSAVSNDDHDDEAVTTKAEKGAAAAAAGGSVVPVVVAHSRRHRRAVVVQQIMTTAQ